MIPFEWQKSKACADIRYTLVNRPHTKKVAERCSIDLLFIHPEIRYLQQLKDVKAHIKVCELGVKDLEVRVVDALKDERWCL